MAKIDPNRLYVALLNTGLQNKDNPLYQVIHDLIGIIATINMQTNSVISSGSAGPQGLQGQQGISGNEGTDGIDGISIQGLPGKDGINGISILLDNDDSDNDSVMFPPGITGVLPNSNFPALTGDVTTPAGSTVTTIGASRVTNNMLAGSIAASKLIGTDIGTVGDIIAGTWDAGVVNVTGNISATGDFLLSVNGKSFKGTRSDLTPIPLFSIDGSDNLVMQLAHAGSTKFILNNATPTTLFTVDFNGATSVKGNLDYSTSQVMSWNSKSLATVYQAASDGFVVALATSSDASFCTLNGFTDSSNPPTTLRMAGSNNGSNIPGGFTMPVEKGNYYKITQTDVVGVNNTVTINWVPLGVNG